MKRYKNIIIVVLVCLISLSSILYAKEIKTITKNHYSSDGLSYRSDPYEILFNMYRIDKSKIDSFEVTINKATSSSKLRAVWLDHLLIAENETSSTIVIPVDKLKDFFIKDTFKVTIFPETVANILSVSLNIKYTDEWYYLETMPETKTTIDSYIIPSSNKEVGSEYEIGVELLGFSEDIKFVYCDLNNNGAEFLYKSKYNRWTTFLKFDKPENQLYCGYRLKDSTVNSLPYENFILKEKEIIKEVKEEPIPVLPKEDYRLGLSANNLANYVWNNRHDDSISQNLESKIWWMDNPNKSDAWNLIQNKNKALLMSSDNDYASVGVKDLFIDIEGDKVFLRSNFALPRTSHGSLVTDVNNEVSFDKISYEEIREYMVGLLEENKDGEIELYIGGNELSELSISLLPIIGASVDIKDIAVQTQYLILKNENYSSFLLTLSVVGIATELTQIVPVAGIAVDNAIDVIKGAYKKLLSFKKMIDPSVFNKIVKSLSDEILYAIKNNDYSRIHDFSKNMDYKLAVFRNSCN